MKALYFSLVGLVVFATPMVQAQDSAAAETPIVETSYETNIPEEQLNDTSFAEAVRISQTGTATLNQVTTSTTGMAISPLFGMGVLGVWQYFKTDPTLRADLPWYSNPWVWGICFVIFVLAKWKDTFGVFVPDALKKPLHVVDIFEDKLSAFIVMLAVIPANVITQMPQGGGSTTAAAGAANGGLFAMVPGFVNPWLAAIPVAILVFLVVWMVSHAVKVLLLLSPSSFINFFVKIAKGMLLAFMAFLSWASPVAGIVFCAVLVLCCIPIFAWAYRWNVFGSIFAWDYLFSRHCVELKDGEDITGFTTVNFGKVKPMSYGKLSRIGDELSFRYRPWMFLAEREVRMNVKDLDVVVRKGLVTPSVMVRQADGTSTQTVVDLRPRFRTREEEIAPVLNADDVVESQFVRGMRAAWAWFRDQFTGGGAPRAVPALETAG